MADIERGRAGGEEERLPWLEAVQDEDAERAPGTGRLVAAVMVALIAIGLVVGGVFWLRDRNRPGGSADGELIAAPAGPYKTRPDSPGGMQVEGQGDTAYAASEGTETNAAIDLNALPETPVAGAGNVTNADAAAAAPGAAVAGHKVATGPTPPPAKVAAADKGAAPARIAAPPAKPAPAPAKPAPAAAKLPAAQTAAAPEPVPTGGTIQLGAFSSQAKAQAAWKTLAGRFSFLSPLTMQVTAVKSGAATLYRLRTAAGGQAGTICGKLKVAGESCARVGS